MRNGAVEDGERLAAISRSVEQLANDFADDFAAPPRSRVQCLPEQGQKLLLAYIRKSSFCTPPWSKLGVWISYSCIHAPLRVVSFIILRCRALTSRRSGSLTLSFGYKWV